jgi:hypothetical protein
LWPALGEEAMKRKATADIVVAEFERRLVRFDNNVIRGRSMTPEEVEDTRRRMQVSFDRMIVSLNQCAAHHRKGE